ncbi:hypothetical protein [Chryseobacterium sp. W4I1]|nr:hypothetical protein [Chryseobacterium sp. W4I1]MDQ0784218.1 hypothetical protein [Chryseobacterium sp. W4I1]
MKILSYLSDNEVGFAFSEKICIFALDLQEKMGRLRKKAFFRTGKSR